MSIRDTDIFTMEYYTSSRMMSFPVTLGDLPSRSRHYPTSNNSKMVQDSAILTTADQ